MAGMLEGAAVAAEVDLVDAVQQILEQSREPLTLTKIRAALPAPLQGVHPDMLAQTLQRQVAAQVFIVYPRYRGRHERYWVYPMHVHIEHLIQGALADDPLSRGELVRHLPDYARAQANSQIDAMLAKGKLFEHPPSTPRRGPRLGLTAPDARFYMKAELANVFQRLQKLGFTSHQLHQAAFEILHEQEWNG